MGTGGLEPPRLLQQRILSPSCLPISPHSLNIIEIVTENYSERNKIVFYSKSRSDMNNRNNFTTLILNLFYKPKVDFELFILRISFFLQYLYLYN